MAGGFTMTPEDLEAAKAALMRQGIRSGAGVPSQVGGLPSTAALGIPPSGKPGQPPMPRMRPPGGGGGLLGNLDPQVIMKIVQMIAGGAPGGTGPGLSRIPRPPQIPPRMSPGGMPEGADIGSPSGPMNQDPGVPPPVGAHAASLAAIPQMRLDPRGLSDSGVVGSARASEDPAASAGREITAEATPQKNIGDTPDKPGFWSRLARGFNAESGSSDSGPPGIKARGVNIPGKRSSPVGGPSVVEAEVENQAQDTTDLENKQKSYGDTREYQVQKGQTLTQIAKETGVSVGRLAEANGIKDPNKVYYGRKLIIPGGNAPSGGLATGQSKKVAPWAKKGYKAPKAGKRY